MIEIIATSSRFDTAHSRVKRQGRKEGESVVQNNTIKKNHINILYNSRAFSTMDGQKNMITIKGTENKHRGVSVITP